MNPQELFCLNLDCPARGQKGKGNIIVHSQKEQRCLCTECHQAFVATKGTIFYRLHTDPKTVVCVLTLLAYGCPLQAIVHAFELDERTVRNWHERAGKHCQAVHENLVEQKAMDLEQVQSDEIKVKIQEGHYWMAMAMMVSTRLWLGGVLSAHRDLNLIQALTDKIKAMALCRPLLLAVDGLASYVTAFHNSFRTALPRRPGETGRPKLIAWPNIAIVQVVKQRVEGKLNVSRRIVQGTQEMVNALILKTQGKLGVINTAFIERLNATFRLRLNNLARKTRTLAKKGETLTNGMYLVGCFYNFCDPHHSLRLKLSVGTHGYRWVQRTPAIATGIADHVWTPSELFNFRVPVPRWEPPIQRGRRSRETLKLIEKWCN